MRCVEILYGHCVLGRGAAPVSLLGAEMKAPQGIQLVLGEGQSK